MIYTSQPEELRRFFREVMGLSATDVGDGWLIFDVPEADLGVHPEEGSDGFNGKMTLSFYTDDLAATVATLRERGATFLTEIEDHGYGLVTFVNAPGDIPIQLYQPKYSKG